jgi:hypothetical protein
MTVRSEAQVKEDVAAFLNKMRVYDTWDIRKHRLAEVDGFYWMPTQNGMGITGVSDFIVVYRGVLIAIETKASNRPAKPTAYQEMFMDNVITGGGMSICVNNVEILAKWWEERFCE